MGDIVPAVSQFTSDNPSDAGLIGRLRKDPHRQRSHDGNPADLASVANTIKRNIRNGTDYENIIRGLPFLKLPISILISSIISPGDLVKQELNIRNTLKGADTTLLTRMDKVLINHFINEMQMQTQISSWVEEAMFTRGSHPVLIIPESTLDKMMKTNNYSEESYRSLGEVTGSWYTPKGILNTRPGKLPSATLSLENQFHQGADDNLLKHTIEIPEKYKTKGVSGFTPYRVTDNPSVLREPARRAMHKNVHKRNAYGTPAFEAAVKKKTGKAGKVESPEEIYANYFKSTSSKTKRLVVMPTSKMEDNEGLGHPLLYHLPPECVAPTFIPGQPESPTGFFVALDGSGYPASYLSRLNFYDDIRTGWADNASGNQQAGSLLQMAKDIGEGSVANYSDTEIDRMIQLNSDIMERDLIARIGDECKIGMTEGFNKMMLARWAQNQYTTLLYVPADYMVYLAFDYTPLGVGKSLLEDLKEQAAATLSIKVAQTLQAMKNAIPGKDLNIKLDPTDKNPEETIVESIREALALAFHHMPTNISSTADVATQIQQSAINVNVEGNEYYPDYKTNIQDREKINQSPDTDLYQRNVDELSNAIGVPSELTNGINSPEFATTAVQQSVLLRKRVLAAQVIANAAFGDIIRIYTMHSGPLCSALMELISANPKSIPKDYDGNQGEFLIDYINSMVATLPEPVVDDMENKAVLIEKFIATLDKCMEGLATADMFTEYDPEEFKTEIAQFLSSLRSNAIRSYIQKHGIMPELDIFTTDDDGNVVFSAENSIISHSDSLNKAMAQFILAETSSAKKRNGTNKKALKAGDEARQAAQDLSNPPEVDESLVSSTDNDETGDAGGDDLGAADEVGDGDNDQELNDQPGSDTPDPAEEEEPESGGANDEDDVNLDVP